ncbi:MAG: SCP2 sterol-binding domain-containing protein [Desulfobacterales bacterium]|nr:MAG: SCP2 sterol-binding domain-containing protein [Desulfobacterales bacterium]
MAYTVAELFRTMPERFKPQAADNLVATVVYEFGDGRKWTVRISNGVLKVDTGDSAEGREHARIIFETENVMLDIITGKREPLLAVLRGDLQVVGDWRLLLKVRSSFEIPKQLLENDTGGRHG